MRIGISQINSTLGDLESNFSKISTAIQTAKEKKCELLVFPECSLLGYHPFDLLERKELIKNQEKYLRKIQSLLPKNLAVLVGLITARNQKKGRPYNNTAALLAKGRKPILFHKQLLPTGDVFDEARFIEPGSLKNNFFSWGNKKFFLTICEDIWAWPDKSGHSLYCVNPLEALRNKVDLVINLSASPYFPGKLKLREYVVKKTSQHFKAPMVYVNLVGAQDEVIYDGCSFVTNKKGRPIFYCESFKEDFNIFDLNTLEPWHQSQKPNYIESLHRSLVTGIRDFCHKIGISRVHLGLSGGIDSAVVACLAVDALGAENVVALELPGPFSTAESLNLARQLSNNLRITNESIEINESYKVLNEIFTSRLGASSFGLPQENLQARLRGLILMGFSNIHNSLLLSTGNKSEYATGYSTLYGDMCGGLAPIGDLTKNQVYELARYYNSQQELIPQQILERAPSAELRPNQKDQDSLPPYDQLDESVIHLVTKAKLPRSKIDHWVLKALIKSEFKRWQAPPILKVSEHSFGRGRRWPIAHRFYD